MSPDWEKGYFRKASIYEAQEHYDEALDWYRRASECNANGTGSRDVELKIKNLTRLVKTHKAKAAAATST